MPQPSITEVNTPQSRCHFALAWADITPPVGIYHRMWGAAKHERATGVHRPLRATVAVFAPMERGESGSLAPSEGERVLEGRVTGWAESDRDVALSWIASNTATVARSGRCTPVARSCFAAPHMRW